MRVFSQICHGHSYRVPSRLETVAYMTVTAPSLERGTENYGPSRTPCLMRRYLHLFMPQSRRKVSVAYEPIFTHRTFFWRDMVMRRSLEWAWLLETFSRLAEDPITLLQRENLTLSAADVRGGREPRSSGSVSFVPAIRKAGRIRLADLFRRSITPPRIGPRVHHRGYDYATSHIVSKITSSFYRSTNIKHTCR